MIALICHCGRRFESDVEGDAWGNLRSHVASWAEVDDLRHGLKEKEDMENGRQNMSLTTTEVLDAIREDAFYQLMLRTSGEWSLNQEVALLQQVVRYLAMKTHDMYHEQQGPNWQRCQMTTCVMSSVLMPENSREMGTGEKVGGG